MGINSTGLMNALTSMASSSGLFINVLGHEPKAAPTTDGMTCAVWWMGIAPVLSSGQSAVSVRVEFWMRVYNSMLQEPQDNIDPQVMVATDYLLETLFGNFDIDVGGTRYVDVFGADGDGVRATPGYLTQDSKAFRTVDIVVPVIVNDAYLEVA